MLERVRDLLTERPPAQSSASAEARFALAGHDLALELPPEVPYPEHEQRDIHDADAALERGLGRDQPRTAIRPRHVGKIPGLRGKVYDFRGTGLCPPVMSGGRSIRIRPVLYVQHIPVIHNVKGTGDLITLGNVLRAQGLNVQSGTDAEGNIALYTRQDELCYHARGVNSISIGTEHMHFGIDEPWTDAQMKAAAYLAWRAWHYAGVPPRNASLGNAGSGLAIAKRSGHTTHRIEADVAGWHDRTDPGAGFHRQHLYDLVHFYDRKRRF